MAKHSASYLVQDEEVKKVELYRPLPLILRLDVLPFLMFYGAAMYIVFEITGDLNPDVLVSILIPLAFLHVLTFLISQWSVNMKCWLSYSDDVSSIDQATVVKVTPVHANFPSQLCELNIISRKFSYQKVTFCLEEGNTFRRLQYPTDLCLAEYKKCKGFEKKPDYQTALAHFGQNLFDIPIPPFMDLFKEHAVAPFFVFQMFSVLLWCLDEYVYYSLLTLFMLVFFECTVVRQRQRNMSSLRQMLRPPHECTVYRFGKWIATTSDGIVPGDIVMITPDLTMSCDLLLLEGSCVVNEAMLTGESIPLRKEPVSKANDLTSTQLNMTVHKKYLVYAGTTVLESSPRCRGYVLRTGFGTTQGTLMRTILFASERVTANNKEAFAFISILLVFAIIASVQVLQDGLYDPLRSKFKLLLHCIMIITSVVPPELPMQLSLAVTTSLVALSRLGVFCTEPFRIPFGGKVSVCCFDKTGTLTSDTFRLSGVVMEVKDEMIRPQDLSPQLEYILAGCHSLVSLNNQISGDALEKALLVSINWEFVSKDTISNDTGEKQVRILQQFPFSSYLKRMSTVIKTKNGTQAVSKGAPEVMKEFFQSTPASFDDLVEYYTKQGCRVLALGYKNLSTTMNLKRQEVECDLIYSGLLILECQLKPDSKKTIRQLIKANHKVKMLTGDNPFTACHVAKQVALVNRPSTLLLQDKTHWISVDDKTVSIPFEIGRLEDLAMQHNLCITGSSLEQLVEWERVIPHVNIFARTCPQQKEVILKTLNQMGEFTSMCGDGTNDVGALKQAHVGVSIVNGPTEWKKPKRKLKVESDPQIVNLGDASIASPFTSKSPSIKVCKDIIRQGRCTLVTTIQMYKILGINCLITAYTLSFLYLHGVKQGDQQMTVFGLFVAFFFLFMTKTKPTKKLADRRPPTSVFDRSIIVSIVMQILIHLICLRQAVGLALPYVDRNDPSVHPDGDFKPSIINTVVYLMTFLMQLNTFVFNHQGHPFMQNLKDNKLLFRSCIVTYIVLIASVFEVFPPLNELLELHLLPSSSMQIQLFTYLVIDTAAIGLGQLVLSYF